MDDPTTGIERSCIARTTRSVLASYINDGHADSDFTVTDTACFGRFLFVDWVLTPISTKID